MNATSKAGGNLGGVSCTSEKAPMSKLWRRQWHSLGHRSKGERPTVSMWLREKLVKVERWREELRRAEKVAGTVEGDL